MESDSAWLRTDHVIDFADALEEVALHLEAGRSNAQKLKWAVVAVVNAIQNLACASLTFPERASLAPDWWDEWVGAVEQGGEYPHGEPWLPPHHVILDTLAENDPTLRSLVDNEAESLELLREFRNDFEHMKVQGLAIEADMLRAAVRSGLRLIGYLGWEREGYQPIFWETSKAQAEAFRTLKRAEAAAQPLPVDR